MTSADFTFDPALCRPLPGRIVLTIDEPPERIRSIVVPDTARKHTESDAVLRGVVLAVGYGPFWESSGKWFVKRYPGLNEADVKPGDRVYFKPLMKDLNRKFIVTSVTRVEAVIE